MRPKASRQGSSSQGRSPCRCRLELCAWRLTLIRSSRDGAHCAADGAVDSLLRWISASEAAAVLLAVGSLAGSDHITPGSGSIVSCVRDGPAGAETRRAYVYRDARMLFLDLQTRCGRHGLDCRLRADGASVFVSRLAAQK